MSATNPHSPRVDPLETRCPGPKVRSRSKSTSSSEGQPWVMTAPWRARSMHDLRLAHDEDLDITFKSGGEEYPCNYDALVISI
ncbi:hypothetical protein B296_00003526 [Ensete ventricosum]|uniref:Uncharacterized protein n=1 Tax=Ensete ventricosum TaxID=4639 RepID=A0A426Z1I1_ENSVE|nr:hypothetical protein B296_00003526 [Ensete ventricosum]